MKKLISVLTTICVVIMVAACGGGKPQHYSEYSEWDIDFREEPTTITYLTIGDKPVNGQTEKVIEELNKILIKKVNAQLDIYYVGWNDYLSNYNRVLDEGITSLDLIGTGTDWLDGWPNVLKGNFYPMSKELLSTFCPMTYASVSNEQWEKCSYNGNIYFIPENEFTQWTNHGFVYRGDIADEAGIGDIKSFEDLSEYVEYVATKRPELIAWDADGTDNIVALGYIMSKEKYVPIYELGIYGLFGAYAEDKLKIVSPYYEGEEFVEFARLMKKWDEMGAWREKLSDAGNNQKEFYSGNTALEQHHTQNYFTSIRPTMELKQPGADARFYWFGKECGNLLKTSILHGAMAVYSGSKNPEKALMVYDVIRNDVDCYRLLRYGIQGTQYEINSSGMIEKPSGYNENANSMLTNFWWGRRDELEIQDSTYSWDEYYDLVDEYEHVAEDYPWDGYNFVSEDINRKLNKVIEVCDEYIPQISYGKYDSDPEEIVLEFRQELKEAGIEEIMAELQTIVDSY
ncbi:DUF3502 domain-containing protein [Butyrivibrio sp. YAB3001]|uniref:DUF3502 domain-containing protein n=1 Tax=Butyrivibrio sp. YAB3001 TaxID=1520812 RepID=UPI0008F68DDA|nr:DUF3502 domain-containing protein [Butyrivibrio sp. YAB3001]SFC09231.1 protein of unknown function [Butyrivibrio sp. YAB3001]